MLPLGPTDPSWTHRRKVGAVRQVLSATRWCTQAELRRSTGLRAYQVRMALEELCGQGQVIARGEAGPKFYRPLAPHARSQRRWARTAQGPLALPLAPCPPSACLRYTCDPVAARFCRGPSHRTAVRYPVPIVHPLRFVLFGSMLLLPIGCGGSDSTPRDGSPGMDGQTGTDATTGTDSGAGDAGTDGRTGDAGVPCGAGTGGGAFQQDADGLLSVEAEHPDTQSIPELDTWHVVTLNGASGDAMRADPDDGDAFPSGYADASPRLDFEVDFARSGGHTAWVRIYTANAMSSESLFLDIDDPDSTDAALYAANMADTWQWLSAPMDVPTPGLHTLHVWMREDGVAFDKIVLTPNAGYVPEGEGPAESARATLTCICGDGSCGGGEDCETCPEDCNTCVPMCGNGVCDGEDDCSTCPDDCGACVLADAFYCLDGTVSNVSMTDYITGMTTLADGTPVPDTEVWFGPSQVPSGSGIDIRGATLVVPTRGWTGTNEYRQWYPFEVRFGLTDMCIAGGEFLGLLPLDIGWHDSKGSFDGAIGDNSAPIFFSSPNTTVTGVYVTNNHDSIRPGSRDGLDGHNWTVAHSWIEYNRDDCIESDTSRGSGQVVDSLFDGCYVGISTRACDTCDRTGDTFTFDGVLLRLEPMPFPYRFWDRNLNSHIYIDPYTQPIDDAGHTSDLGIPFNHGPIFKLNANPDANPRFVLRNNIFLFQVKGSNWYRFPPNDTITACENNTIVWAGEGSLADFEASFQIPANCAGQITFTNDLSVWQNAVADWHARHPTVGAGHLPAVMGDIRIPRWDPQPWPY